MIAWLIFVAAAAVLLYRWRLFLRRRNDQRHLRHITGAPQWWGRR